MTRLSKHVPVPAEDGDRSLAPAAPAGAVAAAPPPDEEEGADFDLRRYVSAVRRYKWLVLGCCAVGGAVGAFAPTFIKPTFVAEATILVPEPLRGGGVPGPIQTEAMFQSLGWVELIKTSYIVLDNVVRDLRLYIEPEDPADSVALRTLRLNEKFIPGKYELVVSPSGGFVLRVERGLLVQRGTLGTDTIGGPAGFSWVPPEGSVTPDHSAKFHLVPPRDVARKLQQDVEAGIKERGANMLAVRLQGTEPVRLVNTVNAIARGFVDSARSLSLSKHRELTETLRLQLDSAQRNLTDAEIAYERFRVATYTLPRERAVPVAPGIAGTSDPALDRYTSMRFELDGLERDKEAIEAALGSLGDTGIAPDAVAYIGVVQQSTGVTASLNQLRDREADLASLRRGYTEANPQVQRLAGEVEQLRRRAIPDALRGLLAEIAKRERDLEDRIGAAGGVLQQIPVRATEEQRLRRQLDLASARYQDLERQYQAVRYAQAAEELGARVLDAAVIPTKPIRDLAMMLLGAGIAGGLGLGLVLSILLDHMDRRIRYPDQVSHGLGLPILGAVPRLRLGRGGTAGDARQTVQVVEALRGIRLGLLHAHGVAGPLMATISSPGPSEGKSLIASNLALAFADAGHRTLLIDGDVRRGDLHRLLDAQRKPGLTDYLLGELDRDELVQKSRFNSLWFVGGGTRRHSAPELLSSPAFAQLLLSFRGSYDVILVDSPPLGAGVDPYILSSATGNLLLVVRSGVSDRELAEAKLDLLDRLPVRVLGAVLNDVQAGGAYRYYGYHYYLDGYETQEEEEEEAAAPGDRQVSAPVN